MAFRFYIQDFYNTTEVDEPNGWRDIRSVLKRDFKTHGMFFNYTEGTLKLGFICDAKLELEAAFQYYGVDAHFFFIVHEDDVEIYRARMDFSTRNYTEDEFEIEVDTSASEVLIKNRRNIRSVIDSGIDFDGNGLAKTKFYSRMFSPAKKRLPVTSLSNSEGSLDAVDSIPGDGVTYIWAQFGFNESTSEEIERTFRLESAVLDAYKEGKVIEFNNDAEIEVTVTWDIDFNITDTQSSGLTTGRVDLWLKYNEDSAFSLSFDTYAGTAPYAASNINLAGTETNNITIPKGAKIWIEGEIRMNTVGTAEQNVQIDINDLTIEVTDKRAIPGSNANWYQVHDVLEKNLAMITGIKDYLYSDLLGDVTKNYYGDGCLSDLMLTNGYQLRQIAGDDKTPMFSFKEITENLDALEAIGYGIERLTVPRPQGIFDVYWETQQNSPRRATMRIYEDITSWISLGDYLLIKNSREASGAGGEISIDGAYQITNLVWNGAWSDLDIDISRSDQFFDLVFSHPADMTWFYGCALSSTGDLVSREQLRLEHWTHFYSNKELIDLGTVDDYSEEPFTEAAYNALEIGSTKYANDEDDNETLEEFMSSSRWTIPIRNAEKTMRKVLTWIGSTFLLQESRILQFRDDTTVANRYDRDIFFADKTPRITENALADFAILGNRITVDAATYENIIYGAEYITVSGADPLNNKTYQLDTSLTPIHNITDDTYIVTMLTSPGANEFSVSCTIEYESLTDVIHYKTETDENITSSSNITRPNYAINLRRTIKRRLHNFGQFLTSILSWKIPLLIKNLEFDINGALTTNTADPCTKVINQDVTENADVNSDDLGDPVFLPNLIHFKTYICETDYQFILDAYQYAQAYTDINYGYIKVTSPRSGSVVTGYLMRMTRSPIDKIAEITLLERNDGLGNPIGFNYVLQNFVS